MVPDALKQSRFAFVVRKFFRKLTMRKRRRAWRKQQQVNSALAELNKYPKHTNAPKHGLPGELVISLTSYPARFNALHLTLKSLLDQSIRPDKVLLWIAHDDTDKLPDAVRALESDTFEVRSCDDLRNFKKILPSLAAYPNAFILICDDDTYYPDDWLKSLVDAFDPKEPSIVCHRAHRIRYLANGRIAPYRTWERNVAGTWTESPRTDILPTGNGGVLYPPGSLPPETTDLTLIRKFSETSDDVWLYFMWRQAGWKAKRLPGMKCEFVEWPSTQDTALWVFHRGGKKDEHLQDMSRHFGLA